MMYLAGRTTVQTSEHFDRHIFFAARSGGRFGRIGAKPLQADAAQHFLKSEPWFRFFKGSCGAASLGLPPHQRQPLQSATQGAYEVLLHGLRQVW